MAFVPFPCPQPKLLLNIFNVNVANVHENRLTIFTVLLLFTVFAVLMRNFITTFITLHFYLRRANKAHVHRHLSFLFVIVRVEDISLMMTSNIRLAVHVLVPPTWCQIFRPYFTEG